MKINPMGNRVLIQPIMQDEMTKGGIVMPEQTLRKEQDALVIAVGEGARGDDGNLIPMSVKPGDKVICNIHAGTDIKVDGKDFIIVNEDPDIVAVVE